MRILSEDTLYEMLQRYSIKGDLRGNIVFSNAQGRREFCRELTDYIMHDEFDVHRQGNVLVFNNRSLIQLTISANRPQSIFDDILVEDSIMDLDLLYYLDCHEFYKEFDHYEKMLEKPEDLGEFETTTDVLEYIGGDMDAEN